jgi:hypothetical protein
MLFANASNVAVDVKSGRGRFGRVIRSLMKRPEVLACCLGAVLALAIVMYLHKYIWKALEALSMLNALKLVLLMRMLRPANRISSPFFQQRNDQNFDFKLLNEAHDADKQALDSVLTPRSDLKGVVVLSDNVPCHAVLV